MHESTGATALQTCENCIDKEYGETGFYKGRIIPRHSFKAGAKTDFTNRTNRGLNRERFSEPKLRNYYTNMLQMHNNFATVE